MPIVRIEDSSARTDAERACLVEALYDALREAFGVSDAELQARYDMLDAGRLWPPGGRLPYLHVEITVFSGRSLKAKRRLYRAICQNLRARMGIDGQNLLILLREHPPMNWGMQGGQAGCDLDFGYRLDI